MKIGQAIENLKAGKRVTRTGWNNANKYLFYVAGSTFFVNKSQSTQLYPEGAIVTYQSHIDIKTDDGTVAPWICTQLDLLTADWEIVSSGFISAE